MKKIFTATLITIVIVELLAFMLSLNNNKVNGTRFGMTTFSLSLVVFFTGVLACIPKATRYAGKGMLIAFGILVIIGTAVCSNTPGISMH